MIDAQVLGKEVLAMQLPVTDDGIRPAGDPDHCFYCKAPKGTHNDGCVCIKRTIVMSVTTKLLVEIPAYYSEEQIHFFYNEGTNCSDNQIGALYDQMQRMTEAEVGCACRNTRCKYIREATEEDHRRFAFET